MDVMSLMPPVFFQTDFWSKSAGAAILEMEQGLSLYNNKLQWAVPLTGKTCDLLNCQVRKKFAPLSCVPMAKLTIQNGKQAVNMLNSENASFWLSVYVVSRASFQQTPDKDFSPFALSCTFKPEIAAWGLHHVFFSVTELWNLWT